MKQLAWVVLLAASTAHAAETRPVVAGERYRAGALHRLLFGTDYRKLWTTPVEVEVLDLATAAGGLTPTTRGGGRQTQSLRFKGADGRRYGFRSVDKDPTSVLPPELQGTLAADVVQDQISSSHPAAPIVAAELQEAAGILHGTPRLVVMPDDGRLGEFRAEFGGMLGTFEEYPTAGPNGTPGYAGVTQFLEPDEMGKRLAAGPADRVDARAFLRARLVDLFLGDWDRHRGQWRWAKRTGDARWQPFPEDRDQAFVRFDGLLLGWARFTNPELVLFDDDYDRLVGATWNGRDLDRRFLAELEKAVWVETAADLQARFTDARIDAAVATMPEVYRRLNGARLAATLKRRRDLLPAVAERWYRFLAREVDVRGTDAAESAEIEHLDDGGLAVRLSARDEGAPYFERRFDARDTREVRLYLDGGADRAVVRGKTGRIRVRLVSGDGDDEIDDSAAGGTRVYDASGANRIVRGPGTDVDARPYVPPLNPKVPWIAPRDWGRKTVPVIWFGGSPDVGAFLGGGFTSESFAFRRHPFGARHSFRAGYATAARTYRAEYEGELRRTGSRGGASLALRASGIEILRFHGFGNETAADQPSAFYKVKQEQLSIEPSLTFPIGGHALLSVGPFLAYAATDLDEDRFITANRPYGSDKFGQAGMTARLRWDVADREEAPTRGARLAVTGRVLPEVWDVEETFGTAEGEAAAFVGARVPAEPTLSLRLGGKRVFGTYPFHEAAFVGGRATVRGLSEQRYAGDAALYGNAELRVRAGSVFLLVPAEIGFFGLADAGRVFLRGESSDRWHTGMGGGLWIAFLKRQNAVSVAVATSEGRMGVYVRGGFLF